MSKKILLTSYGENLNKNEVLKEYPRPQLKRNSYLNLNGIWKYKISKVDKLPTSFDGDILVPFCIESKLSLVEKRLQKDEFIFYYKEIVLDKNFINDKVFLNFMAVDQICDVYLNNDHICHHEGGYLPFKVDIKPYLNEVNYLIVKVKDELNHLYPYGKQKNENKGMWYTPVSGIWQTVFIESVSNDYIEELKITPDIDNKCVEIIAKANANNFHLEILDENIVESNKTGVFKIYFENINLWSPENPFLYNFKVKTDNDEITSYFAFRKFSIEKGKICLNNQPYFLNSILDQGYFSDGIYTPASYKQYEDDILYLKELGFNSLRKHIKIEPLYFYYLCDKLGIFVMQDFVNNGSYNFIRDTALPTIGFKKLNDRKFKVDDKIKDKFIFDAKEIIHHLYNVVSIGYYTIFNEGWGQFDADKLYLLIKHLERTRIIDATSGWFYQNNTDVDSYHIYFKKIKVKFEERPIVVSEFGGYAYKIYDHSYNLNKTYGYKFYKQKDDFVQALKNLYEKEILPIKNILSGCVYTQVSDVEDETNGLITYDRKIKKVEPRAISDLMKKIRE